MKGREEKKVSGNQIVVYLWFGGAGPWLQLGSQKRTLTIPKIVLIAYIGYFCNGMPRISRVPWSSTFITVLTLQYLEERASLAFSILHRKVCSRDKGPLTYAFLVGLLPQEFADQCSRRK